jgi:hypothetical protein
LDSKALSTALLIFKIITPQVANGVEIMGSVRKKWNSLALTETDPPVLTGIDPVTMAGDG